MTCKTCGYSWKTRAKHPKKCPNPLCQASLVKYPNPDKQPFKSKPVAPQSPSTEITQ